MVTHSELLAEINPPVERNRPSSADRSNNLKQKPPRGGLLERLPYRRFVRAESLYCPLRSGGESGAEEAGVRALARCPRCFGEATA